MLLELLHKAQNKIAFSLREPLSKFLKGKKKELPAHLKSVPLQKQYFYSYNAIVLATIREAISRGRIYGEKYDEEYQVPCPMIFIIDH